MRIWTFSVRTAKEILRDPLTLAFGLGFPVVVLLLLSAIQANVPVDLFVIERLAPGVCIFGLSFITLFSATLIAKDRESALLSRLYTTPLTAADFILGYTLPMLPMALLQSLICYVVALCLGLSITWSLLLALAFILPISLLFIGLGVVCGSAFTVKQVGGLCGALLTNFTAWFSGIWFDLELVGGVFQGIANLLPFVHAVELERAVVAGNYGGIFPHLYVIIGYAVAILALAVFVFLKKMKTK